MLTQQPWIRLAPHMVEEYEQDILEGLEVEDFKDACEHVRKTGDEELAKALYDAMHRVKVKDGYPFEEPSDYDSIVACSPHKIAKKILDYDENGLKDRLEGAWTGRIAGCLLGKPTEGFPRTIVYPMLKASGNWPLHKYIKKCDMSAEYAKMAETPGQWFYGRCYADLTGGISPSDDDTNYTVLSLKLVEQYGKDFKPVDVMEAWLLYLPYLNVCTAERVAYRNAAMGLLPPQSADTYNPFREWIGAQIRTDFFGYINPGDPTRAAEMAYRDAVISHVKNGIYGAMFAAAAIAAAATAETADDILNAGLDVIPAKCRLRRDIDLVRQWYADGLSAEKVMDRIHEAYPPHAAAGWVYTNPNTMIVAMAVLYGQRDFGKSMCLAVQACYDTDCNGATVGSILGMWVGRKAIPEIWLEPFHGKLYTNISGYPVVDTGDLTRRTIALVNR